MIEKNLLQHLTRRDKTLRERRAARRPHASRIAQLETLEDRVVLAVGAGVPAIMGTVFDDLNTDGRPSEGEGIADITVQLYQDDGDGLFESGGIDPLVGTQVTDANGDYCFGDLQADSRYFVVRSNQTVDGQVFERFVSGAVNPGLANTLIDEFLTRQLATANPPAPSTGSSVLAFPNQSEVLGGERDLLASLVEGNSEINIRVNPFGLEDVLLFDAAAGDTGTLNVTWDGADNDAENVGLGLAGRDLTDGGKNTGIMLRAGQDGNESSLKVRIYQGSASSFSEVPVALPETGGDADGFVFIPFSDFVGAVSPTNVDAIQMLIDAGESGDGTIDVIGLTGPKVVNIGETINADLWITKDNAVTTVVPGEPVTYVIVARNSGPADVIGARVTDQFPANIQNVTFTSRVSGTASGNTLVGTGAIDDLLDLTSGSSVTYTVQGTVRDDATGFLANTARILPPLGVIDTNLGNNTASDRDVIGRPIDLRASKDDGVRIVEPGDQLTYTIVFSNFGPGTVDGAIAQDLFPDNLENVSYTSVGSTGTSGYTEAGQGDIQDRLVIPEGGRVAYTVSATVSAAPGGTVVNRASIDVPAGFVDTTPENNIEIDTNLVNRAVADLSITKTDNRSTVAPGEQVTYQIVVANDGPANAGRVQIFDTFPPELENVSFTSVATGGVQGNSTSGTEDIDDIVSMDAGSTITYTVVATVVASATGTVTNTATVSSPIPDSNPDNNTATDIDSIAAQLDLSVTKTNGVSQVNPGDNVTYTIVATNNGPSDAMGMSVVDQFPSSLVNATYERTVHGQTTNGAGSINDTLDLAVGEVVTYVVNGTVDPNAAGSLVNTVTVQAPEGVQEINPVDNSATDSDTIIRADVDLAITKRSDSLSVIPGRPIQYEIVVSNIGQTNVSGAVVRDIIPADITDVSYQSVATPGATGNTTSGLGNVEDTVDLNIGSSIIYTVLGQVRSSATGIITNTATVEVGGDSVPGNNMAVDSVVTDPHFDLSIAKDNGIHEVKIGDQVTYSITVRNDGPSDVSNAHVRDFFPQALENVTYSSTATGGATGNLNGTGNINDVVSIPVGGAIAYVATGTVGIDVSGVLTNTATVTGPAGLTELDPNNNSASDLDVLTGVVVLGSEPTVIRRDSIAGEADTDVFEIAAHDTGKMIFNIHFAHQFGDLDLEVTDRLGNSIAVSASESDNEQLVLPVVSQEPYFVRVFGKNGDTNLYDLEIENFAAPVPVVARIAPASDTGMMNDDAITSEGNPRILFQADLTDFTQMGIDILSPVDPTVDSTQIPTAAGVAVEVVITNSQTGGLTRGFASPVGNSTTLFAFTPIGQFGNRTSFTDGEYFANAAVRVYDGAQEEGAATPATGRSQLSDPYWFVIDQTVPPSAERPDLFRVSDSGMSDSDNVTNKMAPAIGGFGDPNTKVRLLGNREGLGLAEIIGQGVVNSNGEWEITTEPLVDGIHHIRAEFEDMAGNISDLGEPLVIEVDTRPPNTPYLDLVRDSDTGMMTADDVTNTKALTFTMTTEDPGQSDHISQFNYKYRLFVRPDSASEGVTGEEMLIYDSAVDDSIPIEELLDGLTNNQLLTKTMAELPDGVHNFKLEVEDRAGNISEDFLLPVTIDTLTPPATVDMIESSDGGMLDDDNVTNKMQPAFAGLSEVGSKVNIFANGILVGQGSVTTDASDGTPGDGMGVWEVTVEPLVDGEYAITSQVTDLAGNTSTSNELQIWVDTTKPNIPFLDLVSDSGIDTSDNITNDMTPTVTVTAGATIEGGANEFPNDIKYRIYDRPGDGGGEVLIIDSYGALQDFTTGGFFVETLPMLDEGVHNLKLEVEDRAGNISDAFLLDIAIDKTLPTVSAALLPASDSGMFDDDNVTRINAPTVVGTGSIGDKVFVLANGTLVGEGTIGSDETDGVVGNGLGAWQVTIDPIDDGLYEIIAHVEDESGNIAEADPFAITIDTAVPNTPLLDLITDGGTSSTDNITNTNTPAVTVTANDTVNGGDNPPPNDIKYRVYDRDGEDNEILIIDSFAELNGFTTDGFFQHVLPRLTDGTHNLKLEVEDRAGNISPDFLLEITIDTQLPTAVTVNLLTASDTGMSSEDNVTRLDQPAFDGLGTVGDHVTLYANGEVVGVGRVGSDETDGVAGNRLGVWEITSEPLDDDVYEIVALVEDEAGNFARSEALTIEVDTIVPNTPFLDLRESDDTGRHNDDNITNADPIVFSATTHDANADLHAQLIPGGQNFKYRVFVRPEFGQEVLVYDSVADGSISDLLDGLTANLQQLTTELNLPEGLHNLKLEVEDRAGNISEDYLFDILIDRTPPTCSGAIQPESDSGVIGNPESFSDGITRESAPRFTGTAEANAVISLLIDGVPVGSTVALPYDGDDAFVPPANPTDIVGNWELGAAVSLMDGVHRVELVCEDPAGNRHMQDLGTIVIDLQGPRIANITLDDDRSLFDPKPTGGPDPLVDSIVVHFNDGPVRTTDVEYGAVVESITTEEGNYVIVGDANGNIPVSHIEITTTFDEGIARSKAELFFVDSLPDDRFTITISDSITDVAGNRLDGESGARAPFEGNDGLTATPPIFPTGDGVPGGDFVARFTIDSRPEIGTWGAGNVWIDTNGNFRFDPENNDFVNRDIVYKLGFTSDDVFSGNFALAGDATDGYDKLAVYGRHEGRFRWLVDTDNDGVPNIDRTDPNNVNGLPFAGRFDGDEANGDEVGVFDGSSWYFDTNHDFRTDYSLDSSLVGYPVIGDFDGDGFDDLATYADDTFMIDFADGVLRGWDGKIDRKIAFGFIGVRERPVAADMDQDGFDDLGLWTPDREGVTDRDRSEWYFLISNGETLLNRLTPQDDPVNTNQTIDFTPVPFGADIYARWGDEFARPVVGNFDPPTNDLQIEDVFYNSKNALDVNNDGFVSPSDALLVINDLIANGSRRLVGKRDGMMYVDVNNDGFVSPSDALKVINRLNRENQSQNTAEGERDPLGPLAASLLAEDAVFAKHDADIPMATTSSRRDQSATTPVIQESDRSIELASASVDLIYHKLHAPKLISPTDREDDFWSEV